MLNATDFEISHFTVLADLIYIAQKYFIVVVHLYLYVWRERKGLTSNHNGLLVVVAHLSVNQLSP